MAKFTVDEFVIELGFQESVMKGLAKVEKQVLPMAKRIEKSLNNAFKVDASKQTQPGINRMVKSVERAGKQINRTLTQAFRVNNAGSEAARQFEANNRQAMRRLRQEMRTLYSGIVPPAYSRPRGGNGGSGGSAPRVTAQQRINDLAQRQHQSAQYGNMSLRTPERAAQYSSRVNALRDQHAATGDLAGFRTGLRGLNYEFAQGTRQAALQAREAQAAARAQAAAASAAESGLGGLASGAGMLVAGFMTLQKAMQYFQESLQVGIERTQAKTMMSSAFKNSDEITAQTNAMANKYGMNETEAQQTAAQLRFTMPENAFSDTDIPKLLENEQVFAHLTGASQNQVGLMNYGLQQVAATDTLSKQDFKQVTTNMPAIVKPLMELTKTKNANGLFEYMKAMKDGGARAKLFADSMEYANKKADAYTKAQHSIIAAQGKYQNAVQGGQNAFFKGYESGFSNLLNSLTINMKDGQGTLNTLGKALGWVFNRLASIGYAIDQTMSNLSGNIGLLSLKWKAFYSSLDKDTQSNLSKVGKIFKECFDVIMTSVIALGGAVGVGGAVKMGAGVVARGAALAGAEGVAAGATAIGASAIPVLAAAAISVITYIAGTKLFDFIDSQNQKSYGKETTGGGNFYKDSPLGKAWDWLTSQADEVKGNWKQTANAPMYPGASVPSQSTGTAIVNTKITLDPISFKPLTLNIPLPDGSIYTTTAQVTDLINDSHETKMMSAQGLGGGWQVEGQNAGYRPAQMKNMLQY